MKEKSAKETQIVDTPKSLLARVALAITLLVTFCTVTVSQSQTSSGATPHLGQIWGSVQTRNMATSNSSRLADVAIVIRKVHGGRPGRIVGYSAINNGSYSVDMGDLPAGKYLVQVDPGGSSYMTGERLVDYPGRGGSAKQNWTVSTDQTAVPALE